MTWNSEVILFYSLRPWLFDLKIKRDYSLSRRVSSLVTIKLQGQTLLSGQHSVSRPSNRPNDRQNIYKRGGHKNRQARERKVVSVKLILNTGVKKKCKACKCETESESCSFFLAFLPTSPLKSLAFNYPKFQRFFTSQGTNLWIFTLTFFYLQAFFIPSQAYIYRYRYIQNIIKHCVLYFMNIHTVPVWYLLFYDNSWRCCLKASIKHNSYPFILHRQ